MGDLHRTVDSGRGVGPSRRCMFQTYTTVSVPDNAHPPLTTVAPGELRAWLLLLAREDASYGWELKNRMLGFGVDADQAAIYRALHALEADGLVTAGWGRTVNGPARRIYTITASGRRELDQRAAELAQRRRTLTRFLRLHRSLRARTASE